MFNILFITPYNAIQEDVNQVINKYKTKDIMVHSMNIIGVEDTEKLKLDIYDVVVARGITYHTIKRLHPNKTVVEIGVSGIDLIRAIAEAKSKYNAQKVMVVAWEGMVNSIRGIDAISDIEVEYDTVKSDQEAKEHLIFLKENQVEAVVGGLMVNNIARSLGVKSVFIQTGKETLEKAMQEAINTAKAIIQQRERAQLLATVIDYSAEAILAVNNTGHITTANKICNKILKLSPTIDLTGKHIEEVIPNSYSENSVGEGIKKLNQIYKYKGTLLSMNTVPIVVKGEIIGTVYTFQKVDKIQQIESEIRKSLYKKGLVAQYVFEDILGKSSSIQKAIAIAKKYSQVESNILLMGETGTGKELFAQSIHNMSTRREGPFVAINCAALPENLLETELFGYVEGAFTGAIKGGKMGLFELAHKGTVFLDEVNEISLTLQAKLLRVLEQKEVRRVGDDKVIPIDVRIITATNANLNDKVQRGEFRRDLIYRLNVLSIKIPPLRERDEDILLLCKHYIYSFNEKLGKNIDGMEKSVQSDLLSYHWPGNIRELKNICERLVVLCESSIVKNEDLDICMDMKEDMMDVIHRDHLGAVKVSRAEEKKESQKYEETLPIHKNERDIIFKVLEKVEYNKTDAAKLLGISRSTLWRKLKEFEEENK
ncbi:MAG: proprionate catabolism activator, Fis family [Clostridia bacterium]|jgi:propionate catabolism operon transcriptional regulator|nr:proprionate catabolism activator, Fis family [Clostridia bacterium]